MQRDQMSAAKRAAQAGRLVQEHFPWIAAAYAQGMTQKEIVAAYRLGEAFRVNDKTARAAVSYALCGHGGGFDVPAYSGLLDAEQAGQIAFMHRQAAGERARREQTGLFVCEKSVQQTAIYNSLIAQGKVSWKRRTETDTYCSYGEGEIVCRLAQLPEFQYQKGERNPSKHNNTRIAQYLNDHFHGGKQVRTGRTVSNRLSEYKKRLQQDSS